MRSVVHPQDRHPAAVLESTGARAFDGFLGRTDRPESNVRPTCPQPNALRWDLVERGRYQAQASWGATLELERRRAEPDAPAGWYLFGELETGAVLGGVLLASRRDDAIVEAESWHRNVSGSPR